MMKELLHTFFQHYLEDRNLNATLAMLSDQIVSIGTGEQEIARNKEELADLLKKEFQEMPGSLHFQFTEYQETPVGSEGYCIFARIHVQFEEGNDLIEMDTRFTGVAGLERMAGSCCLSICPPLTRYRRIRNFSHCATADRQSPKCPLSPVPD